MKRGSDQECASPFLFVKTRGESKMSIKKLLVQAAITAGTIWIIRHVPQLNSLIFES